MPNLKVLYTTGYARNAIVHRGVLDAGIDLFSKSFTTDELGRKLQEIFRRAWVGCTVMARFSDPKLPSISTELYSRHT
jgi:hypothetical protein